jgi:hypothetical protein
MPPWLTRLRYSAALGPADERYYIKAAFFCQRFLQYFSANFFLLRLPFFFVHFA